MFKELIHDTGKITYEAVHCLTRNEYWHSSKECLYYFTTVTMSWQEPNVSIKYVEEN